VRSFSENVSLLERALAETIPDSPGWVRNIDGENWWIEIASPVEPQARKLEISLTGYELNIGFFVGRAGVDGAPYELNAGIPEGEELEALTAAAQFVADLLSERLVLVMRRGFKGGREFLAPRELTPSRRGRLEWIVSWRGTYDWAVPT
jgi:hypothetical protein